MKRLICTVLSILLAFVIITPVGTADSGTEANEECLSSDDEMEYEVTEHIIPVTIRDTENGVCYTWWGEETEEIDMSKGVPEKTKTRTFDHYYYSVDHQYMGMITSVVTGVYSQADNYALITSITPSVSGPNAVDFSTSVTISGDTGYLYVYFLGIYYTTHTYHIDPNGTIGLS